MKYRQLAFTAVIVVALGLTSGCCGARRLARSPFRGPGSCSTCQVDPNRPRLFDRLRPQPSRPFAPSIGQPQPFDPGTAPLPNDPLTNPTPTPPSPTFVPPTDPSLSNKFEFEPSSPNTEPRIRLQPPVRYEEPRVDIPSPAVPTPTEPPLGTPEPVIPTEPSTPATPEPVIPSDEPTPPPPSFDDPPTDPDPKPIDPPEVVDTPSPVILPDFAVVKTDIATGQKPFLDGVDWLKKKGYKTILYLHPPGEDTSAEKRYFTEQGFRFESLAVSPRSIDKAMARQFEDIVNDFRNQPIYVYHDGNSHLAGGMWYLYHRMSEGTLQEKAQEEAKRLGLDPTQDSKHQAMWNAVRQLLEP